MLRSFFLSLAGTAALIAGITGCSDSNPDTDQPTPPPSEVTFQIFLNNITFMSVDVGIQPSDMTVGYYSHVVGKEAFARNWGSDVEVFMADYIDYLCAEQGLQKGEVVEALRVTGNDSWSYYELEPDTDYVVFAVEIDTDGKTTSVPVMKEFTSAKVVPIVPVDCTFDVSVTAITKTNATVGIIPSDKQLNYYFEAIRSDEYAKSEDKSALVGDYIWSAIMNRIYANQESFSAALEGVTWQGDGNTPLPEGALKPGTKYVLVVCGVDSYGRPNTDLTTHEFETEAVIPSTNTFEITVSNITALDARVHVTTTNDDPYYAGFLLKKYYGELSDEQLVSKLQMEGGISQEFNGDADFDGEGMLLPGTDYLVIAVGYDEAATTAVTRKEFRTVAGGDPAECRFEVDVDFDIFWADIDLKPSDNTVFYYWAQMEKGKYVSDTQAAKAVEEMLAGLAYQMGIPMETVMQQMCFRGREQAQFAINSDTEYIVYAVALNLDGKVAGDVSTWSVKSPERPLSDAVCQVSWTHYYNGSELKAYDPVEWKWGEDYEGNPMAYVPAVVTHNAAAVTWYAGIYGQDMSDSSDGSIVKNLIEYGGGTKNSDKLDYEWAYFNDVPYSGKTGNVNTFCAVALDKDGNYGPVFRLEFKPVLSQASPISEITGSNKSANGKGTPQRMREDATTAFRPHHAGSALSAAPAAGVTNKRESVPAIVSAKEAKPFGVVPTTRTANRYGGGRVVPKR